MISHKRLLEGKMKQFYWGDDFEIAVLIASEWRDKLHDKFARHA